MNKLQPGYSFRSVDSIMLKKNDQSQAKSIPIPSSSPTAKSEPDSDSDVKLLDEFSPTRQSDSRRSNKKYIKGKNRTPVCVYSAKSKRSQRSEQIPLESSLAKSIANLEKVTCDSSDKSDDELAIIDTAKMDEFMKSLKKKEKLEFNSSEESPVLELREVSVADVPNLDNYGVGFSSKIDSKNILHSLELEQQSKVEPIREKFKDYLIPETILSQKELLSRAEAHFDIIPKLLDGDLPVSSYFKQARRQRKSSKLQVMDTNEHWHIDWEQYFAGYYGFKRQSIIGEHIAKKFYKQLLNCDSDTVVYWTIPKFCTYILANEIIIRMVMEDIQRGRYKGKKIKQQELIKEAERIIRETVEYGTVVADSIEVENDIDFPEDDKKKKTKARKLRKRPYDQILAMIEQ